MPLSPSTIAVAAPVFSTVMRGVGLTAPALDAADVLRQPEHAVRVGAGEIRLQHQLGDSRRVVRRQADRGHAIPDQPSIAAAGTRPLISPCSGASASCH
jgi:hypothetical protein